MRDSIPDWLEKTRLTTGPLASKPEWGFNGAFRAWCGKAELLFIVSDQMGWEHVSVQVHERGKAKRLPTWDEMCFIKNLLWKDDEVVMQLHPALDKYVNVHPFVLHLWRPTKQDIPVPPMRFV